MMSIVDVDHDDDYPRRNLFVIVSVHADYYDYNAPALLLR